MKLLLLNCVLVLGLLSCKTTQNILGEYGSIVNDHSTFVIKLLDSSKFEYKSRLGLSEKYSYGTFKYKKGNLILISNPDITNENGSVRAEFSEHTDGFILKFFYFDGIRPFKNLDILINDSIKMKTDENGVVKYYGSFNELFVEFMPPCVFFYKFEANKMNIYSIYLSPSNGAAIAFRNENFNISKRGIRFGKVWLRKI